MDMLLPNNPAIDKRNLVYLITQISYPSKKIR